MGMRYIFFRISYLIKTKMGWQKKTFPINPDFKKYISLQEWRDNLHPFFFYGKEIKGLQKHPSEDLKKNLQDLKKGIYTFFNKTKIGLGLDYDWLTNPLTNYKYNIDTHWSKIEDLSSEAGDIKYIWEKARFSFLYDVIRYDYHFEEDQSQFVFEQIEDFIENATIELGGSLDCIVNNAGITNDNLAIRMSLDEWQKVIDTNLTSTFLMSKSAIKKMLKNKSGKIVNITSIVGHTGNIGQANYTASKAGIIAMSKSLAIEYAKKNININCISPGFIKTAMTELLDQKIKEKILSKIPSARLGEPDDIANAVLFLCSNQSKYINGETLHVNGGMYMA